MAGGRTTLRVVAGVVLGVLLLLGAVALWLIRPESYPQAWSTAVVTDDETTVAVTVMGGACDHAEAEVDESAARVTITVTIVDDWFVMGCSDVGVDHEVTVELDEPLGDRELVDGAR